MQDIYPDGPKSVPLDLTKPSSVYKQRAWLALASLTLFVTIYIALALWFAWTAYRMGNAFMTGGPDAGMHLLIGICAAFLAIFMLKALFFIQRGGKTDDVEVTASEQPRLFEFLYRLADEAGAPRPKKVYLSARVNAAVFYDLSILNLIFPAHKNLEIGLALVNVLTISEMKAVLAHEFGHFAQRSMAIGSWVYIAQQIATQVVSKRDVLDKLLKMLSTIDIRVAWIGWILSLVVWSIRSLMDTLLSLVVLAQRALSRQMEFQADLVAVSLTGSDELVHALHKLQAADEAWSRTLSFANAELRQGRIPNDLFAIQTQIIEKLARILNDEDYGKVPHATVENPAVHRVFKTSFANPPEMWSTHPASSDREDNAKRVYLAAPHDERSAWLVFDQAEQVKEQVAKHLMREIQAEPATAEQTQRALDDQYALLQLNPRYRGTYLGRALTRHAAHPSELYEAAFASGDVLQAIQSLYSEQLAHDLNQLRELSEERATLQALRDKQFKATGGRIVHRGREISRKELPIIVQQVTEEEDQVRLRILAQDRQCRSAHLAAAKALGDDWREYLAGLTKVLHYAEHTLANLRDAQGLLGNVFAVVTADGKVSASELKQLLATANMLHAVLAQVHQQKPELLLDSSLCSRLKVQSWAELLEEFTLPLADDGNINDWIRVIDGWVDSTASALSQLYSSTLEQLLLSEDHVANRLRKSGASESASAPSRIPDDYPKLIAGQERKRQQRLGAWDRFQTADGFFPGLGRFLVAGVIVGAVLGFGSITGSTAQLSIYNGLGITVQVKVDEQSHTIPAYMAEKVDLELNQSHHIETHTHSGKLIETFKVDIDQHIVHYVYNVAASSPLVEWTAVYGSTPEQPPRALGAPRWITSTADVFFEEPPQSVKTKGGGAQRIVLSGIGNRTPLETLEFVATPAEKIQVIQAHAAWDPDTTPTTAQWKVLAKLP